MFWCVLTIKNMLLLSHITRQFNYILYKIPFTIIKLVGKIRNNNSLSMFVVEPKYESVVQDEYSKMYKNLQASKHVKQQAVLQKYLAYDSYRHEYGDHYKYSESVPLLHNKENPRCSTTDFFGRSSMLTF